MHHREITHPGGILRNRRPLAPLTFLGAALLAAAAGCLPDDSPVSADGRTRASVGVRAMVVGAQQGTSDQVLEVRVYYFRQTEESIDLLNTRIPVDAEENTRALSVDIFPCLRDPLRSSLGGVERRDGGFVVTAAAAAARSAAPPAEATCDVIVEIALLVNGQEVDRTVVGSIPLTPGSRTEVEAPPLFAGITTPGLEVLSGPTAVEPFRGAGLVRMVIRATDPDRNLSAFQLSHAPEPAFAFEQFPAPIETLTDTLYWFINMSSSNLGTVRVDAFDTKGQDSSLTLPISTPPQTRPSVGSVSATIGGTGTTTVDFTVFDRGFSATAVEILFRDPANDQSLPVLGGLAGPACVRPISGPVDQTTFTVRVTCPTPGQGFAQVIVIPFDQTGPGQAARGSVLIPGARATGRSSGR